MQLATGLLLASACNDLPFQPPAPTITKWCGKRSCSHQPTEGLDEPAVVLAGFERAHRQDVGEMQTVPPPDRIRVGLTSLHLGAKLWSDALIHNSYPLWQDLEVMQDVLPNGTVEASVISAPYPASWSRFACGSRALSIRDPSRLGHGYRQPTQEHEQDKEAERLQGVIHQAMPQHRCYRPHQRNLPGVQNVSMPHAIE